MADAIKQPYNSYLIEGDLYVGVSTILNVESAGDFLIPWALRTFGTQPDPMAAHKQFMDEVSSIGTSIHKYIELDLAGKDGSAVATDATIDAITAYHDWKKEHEIEVLANEMTVHHSDWRCAGTLDGVLKVDGKLYVADWKTGKFKDRYFTQLAAYKAMLERAPKSKKIPGIEDAELAVIEINRDGAPAKFITLQDKYHGEITYKEQLGIFHALRYIWYFRNMRSRVYSPVIKGMESVLDPMNKDFQKTFNLIDNKGDTSHGTKNVNKSGRRKPDLHLQNECG